MRNYDQPNLSRRLGPVFSEMAARQAAIVPHRPVGGDVMPPADSGQSKAYKPTHGGYPNA